jgi:hypothetical protein
MTHMDRRHAAKYIFRYLETVQMHDATSLGDGKLQSACRNKLRGKRTDEPEGIHTLCFSKQLEKDREIAFPLVVNLCAAELLVVMLDSGASIVGNILSYLLTKHTAHMTGPTLGYTAYTTLERGHGDARPSALVMGLGPAMILVANGSPICHSGMHEPRFFACLSLTGRRPHVHADSPSVRKRIGT